MRTYPRLLSLAFWKICLLNVHPLHLASFLPKPSLQKDNFPIGLGNVLQNLFHLLLMLFQFFTLQKHLFTLSLKPSLVLLLSLLFRADLGYLGFSHRHFSSINEAISIESEAAVFFGAVLEGPKLFIELSGEISTSLEHGTGLKGRNFEGDLFVGQSLWQLSREALSFSNEPLCFDIHLALCEFILIKVFSVFVERGV